MWKKDKKEINDKKPKYYSHLSYRNDEDSPKIVDMRKDSNPYFYKIAWSAINKLVRLEREDHILDAEWVLMSNFISWCHENYITNQVVIKNPDGTFKSIDNHYVISKDIFIKNNKIYGPDTCCFVPKEIAKLFEKEIYFKLGVYPVKKFDGIKFMCDIMTLAPLQPQGVVNGIVPTKVVKKCGTFNTQEEAIVVFKTEKEKFFRELATSYKGKIDEKTYLFLMNYTVSEDEWKVAPISLSMILKHSQT